MVVIDFFDEAGNVSGIVPPSEDRPGVPPDVQPEQEVLPPAPVAAAAQPDAPQALPEGVAQASEVFDVPPAVSPADRLSQTPPQISGGELSLVASVVQNNRDTNFEHDFNKFSPDANTLKPKLPPGATPIHPEDGFKATQAVANSFPSMNEIGMILDPMDRTSYAIAVMGNDSLRSDIKAQVIETAMRRGTIAMEALSREWFLARGINLRPIGGSDGLQR